MRRGMKTAAVLLNLVCILAQMTGCGLFGSKSGDGGMDISGVKGN